MAVSANRVHADFACLIRFSDRFVLISWIARLLAAACPSIMLNAFLVSGFMLGSI
jgi:hypothetical protein